MMAGLLDSFFGNADQTQALGLLGAGLMNRNFSGGAQAAMQHMAGAKDRERKGLLSDMQLKEAQMKLADMQAQQDWRTSLPSPDMLASQQALSGGGGPTVANAARMPTVSPQQQLLYGGFRAGVVKPDEYLKAFAPAETPFGKVDPKDYTSESIQRFAVSRNHADLMPARKMDVVGNRAVNLYDAKPGTVFDQTDPNQPFGIVNGKQTANMPFQQFSMSRATASAPKVHMPAINLSDPTAKGRAALDFQDKVRAAQKDHFTFADNFRTMNDAVKNSSPQGDTTLLYSFFKTLDPTSTVREGEVAMVKDNRSIPDRFKAMASKLAGGGSLLQHEREDILTQATRMGSARKRRSDMDVSSYRDNAARFELDPKQYVPDPFDGLKFGASVSPTSPMQFPDAGKEQRYQEWKRKNGG